MLRGKSPVDIYRPPNSSKLCPDKTEPIKVRLLPGISLEESAGLQVTKRSLPLTSYGIYYFKCNIYVSKSNHSTEHTDNKKLYGRMLYKSYNLLQ